MYLMPSSATRAKSAFRVRVRYMYNRLWSEWSPTQRFGEWPRPPRAAQGPFLGAPAWRPLPSRLGTAAAVGPRPP